MTRDFRFGVLAAALVGVTVLYAMRSDTGAFLVPCGTEGPAADPPGFDNCARCHNEFPVNSGDGSLRLEGLPVAWSPGTTYRLSGILEDPGQRLWGFHVTAIDRAGNAAGTLSPTDGTTFPCTVNGRPYLSQSAQGRFAGVENGPVVWNFDWTAPAAGVGAVSFYADGIACNFDHLEGGDFTYTTASAVLEDGVPGTGVTLLLQPDKVTAVRGTDFVIRARIQNHGDEGRTMYFASFAELESRGRYPPSGFLVGPIEIELAAHEQCSLDLVHRVPTRAPQVTVRYSAVVGVPPRTRLAGDGFDFTVQ